MLIELEEIRGEIESNIKLVSGSESKFNDGAIYAYKKLLAYLDKVEKVKNKELKEWLEDINRRSSPVTGHYGMEEML